MEIIQDDAKKLVQVWLSRKESGDEALQNQLKPMYAQWKQQKYMVAVFHSGQEDLKENTMALLAYNKRRSAELAVQREKKRRKGAHRNQPCSKLTTPTKAQVIPNSTSIR